MAESLETYEASSFHQLWYPSKRWGFTDFECCLEAAGGLQDTRAGKRSYRDYLAWLSADDEARRRLGFETSKKSERWKVALARYLRERLLVPNAWLAVQLHMGTAQSVSSRISQHRRKSERGELDDDWNDLGLLECVDWCFSAL